MENGKRETGNGRKETGERRQEKGCRKQELKFLLTRFNKAE